MDSGCGGAVGAAERWARRSGGRGGAVGVIQFYSLGGGVRDGVGAGGAGGGLE